MWQDILKIAIVGTERNAFALPARNDALGNLLATLDANAREASLLSAAATVALYERVGQLPAVEPQALSAPAEMEDVPCCNARAAQHLSLMLNGEFKEVLPEWLAALAQSQQHIPAEFLPQLLNAGFREIGLRESSIRVIGKRGIWLARQNPEWKYAIGEIDEATWETDSHAARLALIKRLHAQTPAAATHLLRSSWQENSPKERVEFLEVLRANLSLADEDFLEFTLDDRSTIVRQAAAGLLSNLPDSAFVKRMIERARPLVFFSKKPRNKFAVEITLPSERTEAMIRDGITAKSPYPAVGEKTWWLTLMIEAIPFAFWPHFSGLTGDQLMQAIKKSEWEKIFFEAWLTCGFRSGDIELIEAILPHNSLAQEVAVFAQGISDAHLDMLLIALLNSNKRADLIDVIGRLLIRLQTQWSQELSKMILAEWELIFAHLLKRLSYYISNLALYFNTALIPQMMAKISTINPAHKTTDNLMNILQFRAAALKEITQ